MQGSGAAADALDSWRDPGAEPALQAAALRKLDARLRHGPRTFSWLIYRMTNPVMRDLFMGPRNPFRVKEALLSLLAGDIYGRTPIWGSLRIFKLIYYTSSLVQLPTALRAWRRRQANLRPVDEAAGAR